MKVSEGLINKCKWKVYNEDCLKILSDMIKQNYFVDCIMTSPPYFDRRAYGAKPKSDGNVAKWLYANSGQAIHGEIGNGKNKNQYLQDMKSFFELSYKVLKEKKFLFVNISTSHYGFELIDFSSDFINLAKEAGFVHWDTIIWIKRNPMPSGRYVKFYLAQGWEYILAFSKGKKIEINNKNLKIQTMFRCKKCDEENYIDSNITPNYVFSNIGCYGRKRYPLISHPALFPIDIPAYCLSIATNEGDRILDPFAGSGTTLIAGLEQGLDVIGCELVPQIYNGLIEGLANID